jgi:hypothetical protein
VKQECVLISSRMDQLLLVLVSRMIHFTNTSQKSIETCITTRVVSTIM